MSMSGIALEAGELLGREVEGGVDVAVLERQELRCAVADVADHDALEGHLAAPVVRVLLHHDLRVPLPGHHVVGAGAGGVLVEPLGRAGPGSPPRAR